MSKHAARLVDQPGRRPTGKLTAATGGSAATVLVLWLAQRAGLHLSELQAEAVVVLVGFAAGYIKRDKTVAATLARVEHELGPVLPQLGQALAGRGMPPVTGARAVGMLDSPHVTLTETEAVRDPEAPPAG